jgi:hypothetical protein
MRLLNVPRLLQPKHTVVVLVYVVDLYTGPRCCMLGASYYLTGAAILRIRSLYMFTLKYNHHITGLKVVLAYCTGDCGPKLAVLWERTFTGHNACQ